MHEEEEEANFHLPLFYTIENARIKEFMKELDQLYQPKILKKQKSISFTEDSLKHFDIYKTLQLHQSTIHDFILSPECNFVFSCSFDRTVKMSSLKNANEIHVFYGHVAPVQSICTTGDCAFIISGSWDASVKIWNTKTKKVEETFLDHESWVICVCLTFDNQYLISCSADKSIKIYDFTRRILLNDIQKAHDDVVTHLCTTNSNQYVISASLDKTIKIWDLKTAELKLTIHRTSAIWCVKMSSDDKFIYSGEADGRIVITKFSNGDVFKILDGHLGIVRSIDISFDGNYLVSGSSDGIVKIWNLKTGALIKTLTYRPWSKSTIYKVHWSSKGIVSSHENEIVIWTRKEEG